MPVHIHVNLRNRREKGRKYSRDLGPFLRGFQESIRVVRKKFHIVASAVFEDVSHTAGSTDTGNRGRRESDCGTLGKFAENVIEMNDQVYILLILRLPLPPWIEGHPEKRVVSRRHPAQHAVANHGCDMRHAGGLLQKIFHIACSRRRTLQ